MTVQAVEQVVSMDQAQDNLEQIRRKYKLNDLGTRSDHIKTDEMIMFREDRETRRYLSKSDREAANFGDAVFLDQINNLRFHIGQRVRITDQDAEVLGGKAVVLGDYERYVLLELANKHGDERKLTLLKADILRGWSGDSTQRGGRVKIELH